MNAESIKALKNNKNATLADIRAAFASLKVTKAEAFQLSLDLGYTQNGTKKAVLARIQSNLESLVMSQYRVAVILGKS